MNLSTFIETGKIPASARDRACLLDAARSEILTNKTMNLSEILNNCSPDDFLTESARCKRGGSKSPHLDALVKLAGREDAKAPTTRKPTASAPLTKAVVVQPPPPAHQGETAMGRKLRLSRESCAAQGQAEAVKHQPSPGKVLTKSAFDLLTASAKMEFFRDGGKLV